MVFIFIEFTLMSKVTNDSLRSLSVNRVSFNYSLYSKSAVDFFLFFHISIMHMHMHSLYITYFIKMIRGDSCSAWGLVMIVTNPAEFTIFFWLNSGNCEEICVRQKWCNFHENEYPEVNVSLFSPQSFLFPLFCSQLMKYKKFESNAFSSRVADSPFIPSNIFTRYSIISFVYLPSNAHLQCSYVVVFPYQEFYPS